MVKLSGTGVPPGLLDEVPERRSGTYRGGGAAYRLVPAEIKHCGGVNTACSEERILAGL